MQCATPIVRMHGEFSRDFKGQGDDTAQTAYQGIQIEAACTMNIRLHRLLGLAEAAAALRATQLGSLPKLSPGFAFTMLHPSTSCLRCDLVADTSKHAICTCLLSP